MKFPLFYDNYFVPRGYAVVLVDLAGTNRSAGCADVGGTSDVDSARKVVDWLNGRATGYSAKTGGSAVTGELDHRQRRHDRQVLRRHDRQRRRGDRGRRAEDDRADLGDQLLVRLLPLRRRDVRLQPGRAGADRRAAQQRRRTARRRTRSSRSGATANGDYGPLWAERDYAAHAGNVRASVLLSHGVNDLNVKTINFGQWWSRAERREEDLAVADRARRPVRLPARRLGRPAAPVVRPLPAGHRQRRPERAAGQRRAAAGPVGRPECLPGRRRGGDDLAAARLRLAGHRDGVGDGVVHRQPERRRGHLGDEPGQRGADLLDRHAGLGPAGFRDDVDHRDGDAEHGVGPAFRAAGGPRRGDDPQLRRQRRRGQDGDHGELLGLVGAG